MWHHATCKLHAHMIAYKTRRCGSLPAATPVLTHNRVYTDQGVWLQNWKTQRPARDDVAALLQEAAGLPCLLEELHIIARLLAAYDRWLVRVPSSTYPG